MLQLPPGRRCTVRALQGWIVEVIRQLCDILFWCLAVWAPRGPSPPRLLIHSWNTCDQTTSDEELVAVDHKKNIRAMSHKEGKVRDWWMGMENRKHCEQVGQQLRYRKKGGEREKWRTKLRRTVKGNKAKRDGERERSCALGQMGAPLLQLWP